MAVFIVEWAKQSKINIGLATLSCLLALCGFVLLWPSGQTLTVGIETIEQPLSLALRGIESSQPQVLTDEGLVLEDFSGKSISRSKKQTAYSEKQLKPVNINTASLTELQHLPNVGPKMAMKILAYRKKMGRFSSIQQLLDVPGIGTKKLAKMKPYCLL